MMDEQLIDEVAEHAVIYNRQKYYLNGSTSGNGGNSGHKYETKDEAWQVIAMKLRSDVETCKKRWKYLRERYVSQRKQGDPPVYEHLSRPYLEKMKFLDQHIQPRKSYRNVPNFLTSPHSANSSTFNDYNMDSKSNSSLKNLTHFGNHNHPFHSQPTDPQHAMNALSSAATVLENDSRVKIEADQVFRDFAAAVASQQLQHISQSQIQQQAAAVAAAMADSSQTYSDNFREANNNVLGSMNNTTNNNTINGAGNGGVPSSSSSIKSPLSSPLAGGQQQNGSNNNINNSSSSSITPHTVANHSSSSANANGSGGTTTNHQQNMNNQSFNKYHSDDMDSSTNSNYNNMKKPRVQLNNSLTNINNNTNGSHPSSNNMIVNNSPFVADDTDDDSDENGSNILHPQTILNEHVDNPFNTLTSSSATSQQQRLTNNNSNNIGQHHTTNQSTTNMFSSNADFLFQLYQQLPHQQQQQQQQQNHHNHHQQPQQQQQHQSSSGTHQFNKFQVPQLPPQSQLQRSSEHLLGELVTTELLKMSKERRKNVQKRILEILFFDD